MSDMKEQIAAIIAEFGVENLSCKTVRVKLEEKRGMEPGELKPQKAGIQALIDECIQDAEPAAADGAEESEEEAARPPKKRAKGESSADPEEKKEKNHSCTTRTGEEAPKAAAPTRRHDRCKSLTSPRLRRS